MAINPGIVLQKMIQQCENAEKYTRNISYEEFVQNELYLTFTVFALTQLGELASVLSSRTDFQHRYPSLPWTAMKSLRNHIVHDYDGLRMTVVWSTVQEDIPLLKTQLMSILSQMNISNGQ